MSEHRFGVDGQADSFPYYPAEEGLHGAHGEPRVQLSDLLRAMHLHRDRLVPLESTAAVLGFEVDSSDAPKLVLRDLG
jgi:hypothetical protein